MFCIHFKKLKGFLVVSIFVEQNGRRTVIRVVNRDVFICSDIRTWIRYSTCYMKRKRIFVECFNDINLTFNYNISRHVGYILVLPVQVLTGPLGSRSLRFPEFIDSWCMKVVKFTTLQTPMKKNLVIHFCSRLSWPQGHIAGGKIKSMKNTSDPIGNRTYDPQACSAVM
jgi:hypothetical protein